MHVHNIQMDIYRNLLCRCGKVFVRNNKLSLDELYRTDADRNI